MCKRRGVSLSEIAYTEFHISRLQYQPVKWQSGNANKTKFVYAEPCFEGMEYILQVSRLNDPNFDLPANGLRIAS